MPSPGRSASTFRGGLQWTFTYGIHNELTAITDSYNKVLLFDWRYRDPSTLDPSLPPLPIAVSKVTLPDGTTLDYTYDASVAVPGGLDYSDRLLKAEHKNSLGNVLDADKL